ncbi:MAG: hypothetical protein J4N97_11910, partial [Chloroflexi bacterium]|nr:hypothetical protein [Chloroflexota bacterium]
LKGEPLLRHGWHPNTTSLKPTLRWAEHDHAGIVAWKVLKWMLSRGRARKVDQNVGPIKLIFVGLRQNGTVSVIERSGRFELLPEGVIR